MILDEFLNYLTKEEPKFRLITNENIKEFKNTNTSKIEPKANQFKEVSRMLKISVSQKPRKDGRYEAKYPDPFTQKRKSAYGKTPELAYNKAYALATGQIIILPKDKSIIKKQKYKLNEWLWHWHKNYRIGKKATKTIIEEERYIKIISKDEISKYYIDELNGDEIQQYLNKVEKLSGNRTMLLQANILSCALEKAKKLGKIEKNPFEAVEIVKKEPKKARVLTRQEQKKFIKAIQNHKYKLAFYLMLFCGLRPGEAIGIKKSDFDLENKTLYVQRDINEAGEEQPPKRNSFRTVPINNAIYEIIKKLPDNNNYIFHIKVRGLNNSFKKICQKHGIFNISQKSLRHTFNTRLKELGVHLKVIQKWMGHKTLKMTSDTYGTVLSDWEKSFIPNLEQNYNISFDDKNNDNDDKN